MSDKLHHWKDVFGDERFASSGGKPTFPTSSLIRLGLDSLIERLSSWSYRLNGTTSQVRKVGLPPLLRY